MPSSDDESPPAKARCLEIHDSDLANITREISYNSLVKSLDTFVDDEPSKPEDKVANISLEKQKCFWSRDIVPMEYLVMLELDIVNRIHWNKNHPLQDDPTLEEPAPIAPVAGSDSDESIRSEDLIDSGESSGVESDDMDIISPDKPYKEGDSESEDNLEDDDLNDESMLITGISWLNLPRERIPGDSNYDYNDFIWSGDNLIFWSAMALPSEDSVIDTREYIHSVEDDSQNFFVPGLGGPMDLTAPRLVDRAIFEVRPDSRIQAIRPFPEGEESTHFLVKTNRHVLRYPLNLGESSAKPDFELALEVHSQNSGNNRSVALHNRVFAFLTVQGRSNVVGLLDFKKEAPEPIYYTIPYRAASLTVADQGFAVADYMGSLFIVDLSGITQVLGLPSAFYNLIPNSAVSCCLRSRGFTIMGTFKGTLIVIDSEGQVAHFPGHSAEILHLSFTWGSCDILCSVGADNEVAFWEMDKIMQSFGLEKGDDSSEPPAIPLPETEVTEDDANESGCPMEESVNPVYGSRNPGESGDLLTDSGIPMEFADAPDESGNPVESAEEDAESSSSCLSSNSESDPEMEKLMENCCLFRHYGHFSRGKIITISESPFPDLLGMFASADNRGVLQFWKASPESFPESGSDTEFAECNTAVREHAACNN